MERRNMAEALRSALEELEKLDEDEVVHTVMFELNGQHGGVDVKFVSDTATVSGLGVTTERSFRMHYGDVEALEVTFT